MTSRRVGPGHGLSAKILGLAVIFLLVGEILIFLPSIARYRLTYLEEKIASAHLATLAASGAEGQPPGRLDPAREAELLAHVGALAISLWRPQAEVMLGRAAEVDRVYDLRGRNPLVLILDVLETLIAGGGRVIRVVGPWPRDAEVVVDVVLHEGPMRQALVAYGGRILGLSVVLSAILASLLFLALRRMIVRPLGAITDQLAFFRARPEDTSTDGPLSPRGDEIGFVEAELRAMQRELRQSLKEKTRLAALGAAIGQLSHDLKNILASAVLLSDRLEVSADPAVRALAPRLVGTLERAIRLCTETLRFARERPPEPHLVPFAWRALVSEVVAEEIGPDSRIEFVNEVPPDLLVVADRDQMFRVVSNLVRKAREALSGGPGRLTCRASLAPHGVEVLFADDGPGIAPAILPRLFETFSGSTKTDGSGLGLAICREIMRSHGGEIELVETGSAGTVFRLLLPAR